MHTQPTGMCYTDDRRKKVVGRASRGLDPTVASLYFTKKKKNIPDYPQSSDSSRTLGNLSPVFYKMKRLHGGMLRQGTGTNIYLEYSLPVFLAAGVFLLTDTSFAIRLCWLKFHVARVRDL